MTRKLLLIAGVAGLALTAPVSAGLADDAAPQAQERKGGDRAAQRAERKAQGEARQAARVERPQRVERSQRAEAPRRERVQMQRAERPRTQPVARAQRAEAPQRAERQRPLRVERQARVERARELRAAPTARPERQRAERRVDRIERKAERRIAAPRRIAERTSSAERIETRRERVRAVEPSRVESRIERRSPRQAATLRATREMRPMAPFRATSTLRRPMSIGERIDRNVALARVPQTYAARYVDTRDYYYRYDDDYGTIYRIDRDDGMVRSMIPLFGGYGIGDPWPRTYYSSYVPQSYQGYYYDTPDYYYRNDGYGIYQVDSSTQLITALVALLTGQNLGIGQMLPSSYGVYNVPSAYRGQYFDTNDAWYRYDDGTIYQVDPYSRRIEASYPMYGDDGYYGVGSAWPMAYPDYNVPYGYRSLYADTPQHQYRYGNNGIYQVNPTNRLITALVALVSGQQLGVGQPMPSSYGIYNVPMAYRDRYYDTNEDWYRYADGYVYQVNPRTGLIEEAIPLYA